MNEHWATKPLAEVCEFQPPKSEARARLGVDQLVSFAPMESLGIGEKRLRARHERPLSSVVGSYTYFADGDVLLAKITPCFENGKLGVASRLRNGIGFGSSEFIVLRPSSRLDSEFLYYFLDRPQFRIEGAARMGGAVGQQRVPKDFVQRYPIPLPPLREQRRIVGILDKAFERIATAKANAEKSLRNARALFESQLQAIFTRPGTGWISTTLGAEVDLLAGFAFKSAQYTKNGEGIRLLRGDNIIQGRIRWDDARMWPAKEVSAYERYRLRIGDVVLAMDRPWVSAGLKCATISADDVPCLLVQRTARLRGKAEIDNRFLMYVIGSEAFVRHILGVQTGIGVPHISARQILDFAFDKPTLTEQRCIADRLNALAKEAQRLAQTFERKLAALDDLKKSLLHQAFSGNL